MEPARMITLLAAGPTKVHTVVAGLSEEQLRRRPAEGEWSIKEIIGHLRDSAELLGQRVSRIATEEEPYLPEFDQDALAKERDYQEEVVQAGLLRYAENRQTILDLLRSLPASGWDRPGNHWQRGQVTLRDMVENMINHDQEHLAEIRRLAAS